jgi:hypothetical protein
MPPKTTNVLCRTLTPLPPLGLDLKVKALHVLIRAWNPDWGAICNWPLYQAVQPGGKQVRLLSYIGSVTYVSRRRGEIPEGLRSRFYVKELESFGSLIYLSRHWEQGDTSGEHVKAALEVHQILERHGIYYQFPASP